MRDYGRRIEGQIQASSIRNTILRYVYGIAELAVGSHITAQLKSSKYGYLTSTVVLQCSPVLAKLRMIGGLDVLLNYQSIRKPLL